MLPPPPRPTLFPYTTLFRSSSGAGRAPPSSRSRRTRSARGVRWRLRAHAAPPRSLGRARRTRTRSEEHTSELQSHSDLVCRLLLEKKKKNKENRKSEQTPTH